MEIFTSSLLQTLSDEQSRRFQELLPELVKRLIIDSVNSIKYIRIPSKNDIWAPGFDGIIETDMSTHFVAEGKSVWEFGTNKDSLKKINSDYDKRTNKSLNINKKETVFYLVVPKIWAMDKSITQWEDEKKDWKKVRVYDAVILCDWINSCPVVAAWLAEELLILENPDFKTVLSAWNSFAKYTCPELSHELFLSGRDKEKKIFLEYLSSQNVIKVKSYAMLDAFGFCLSSIMTDELLANSVIVVYNVSTYRELSKIVKGKIFLIFNSYVEIFDENNKTIICYNNENPVSNEDVLLSLLKKNDFLDGLRSMGVSGLQLSELFHHTQGHLLALINKIPDLYNSPKPSWYNDPDKHLLVPLLFLRKIDVNTDSYRKICELLLLQNNYNELILAYNKFSKMDDAPVKKIDSIYSIINSEIVWKALNLDENGPELEQLFHTIIHIIDICNNTEENDLASLDLSKILHTLICDLSTYKTCSTDNAKLKEYMKTIVNSIWKCKALWHSLSIIAEIEPDLLMQEYENDYYENENSNLKNVFSEGDHSGDYAEFLHSFVRIADSQNSAVKTCKMLFDLCQKDIKYIFNGSTPFTTLLSILWLCIENNALSLKKKKNLIILFLNTKNELGLKIAIESIRKDSDLNHVRIGSAIKEKHWVSKLEYIAVIKEIFNKVTEVIISEPNTEYILEIIRIYFYVPFEQFEEFLDCISGLELKGNQLFKICYLLREKVFWNEMSDNKSLGKYMNMFKKYVRKFEDKLPIKRLFAFYGSPFSFPYYEAIIDEDKSNVDDYEQIRKYRISWLNEIDVDDICIAINSMDNSYYWGILLSESKFKTNALHVVNIALKFRKFAVTAGVIDSIEINQAVNALSTIGSEEIQNIFPFLERDDILSYFNSDSSVKSYWSYKTMRVYDVNKYKCLLKYNPVGLLSYYAYRITDISDHSNEVMEILDAICKTGENISNHISYIDKIINRLDNTGYYSDEYALICLKISELRSNCIEMYECIKHFYFIHYDNLAELLNDDKVFYDFIYRYSIPKDYKTDTVSIKRFLDSLYEYSNHSNRVIEFIGVVIGKILKSISTKEFVNLGFPDIVEKYNSPKFRSGFSTGYHGMVSIRVIEDGSDLKSKSDEILKAINEIDIEYPYTFEILNEIADNYIKESKSDFLYSEFSEI